MRKKITIVLNIMIGIIIFNTLQAQQQETNFGDFSRPVASVSSLATYTNIPISVSVGIPNISVPLFELPSKVKGISAQLSLAYNSINVTQLEPASEVGTGWSLFAGGVISREIIGSLNEVSILINSPNISNAEKSDDIFYYNLPGISGKFKFNKNTANNTIDIVNLSSNKAKISYIREINPDYHFIIKSFTITDENGYQYFFNDYSQSTYSELSMLYRSAFFLTKILLPDNTPIVGFEYRKDSRKENETSTSSVIYTSCKLTKIKAEGVGSVNIDYVYDRTLENTMNDPYSITQILLKNTVGNIISGYKFNYTASHLYGFNPLGVDEAEIKGRRFLNKLIKLNKDLTEYEKTGFTYNPHQFLDINTTNTYYCNPAFDSYDYQDYNLPGLIKKIISPTGGVTQYNYEPHDYFFNRGSPAYLEDMLGTSDIVDVDIQYKGEYVPVLNIDTNQNSTYNLTISGNSTNKKTVFFKFLIDEYYQPGIWVSDPEPDPNDQPSPDDPGDGPGGHYHFDLTYTLKKDGIVINRQCGSIEGFSYYLYPGNYTVTISGTGGKGKLLSSEIKLKSPPYLNKKATYEYGPRIESIQYYNSITETTPIKTERYSYNQFGSPNNSSGYIFRNESEEENYSPGYVLYRNVSVTDDKNGYTRNYYKSPDDYPETAYTVGGNDTSFWHYYTLTRSGILEKKEIYNNQNQIVESVIYDYTFETLNNLPDLKIRAFNGMSEKYTKPSFITNIKVSTKNYTSNNQYLENKSETDFSTYNYRENYIKETSSDGTNIEKWIKYPFDKNNAYLLYPNITSRPLEVETKINGKSIEKIETEYASINHFYPTSVKATNPNDGSVKTGISYDQYDVYGNVMQFTKTVNEEGQGVTTTIIWGYDQTLPIAKIEGAKISDIGNLADQIIAKSNVDINDISETDLINTLDNFRTNPSLKNFQITTYTYNPLIGITTITPPNGMRETYKYDQYNRLQYTIDVNGNILKDYRYNTKPQP